MIEYIKKLFCKVKYGCEPLSDPVQRFEQFSEDQFFTIGSHATFQTWSRKIQHRLVMIHEEECGFRRGKSCLNIHRIKQLIKTHTRARAGNRYRLGKGLR